MLIFLHNQMIKMSNLHPFIQKNNIHDIFTVMDPIGYIFTSPWNELTAEPLIFGPASQNEMVTI